MPVRELKYRDVSKRTGVKLQMSVRELSNIIDASKKKN